MTWRKLDNLKELGPGLFQLNPDAYCPLTITAPSIAPVIEIQNLFLSANTSPPDIIKSLRRVLNSHDVRIKEIDEPGSISEPELRKAIGFSSPIDRAELVFWIYGAYFYRRQTIERSRDAFKHGAVDCIKYDKMNCQVPECQARHGKKYSLKEALEIKFRPGCKCDISAYNSRWA